MTEYLAALTETHNFKPIPQQSIMAPRRTLHIRTISQFLSTLHLPFGIIGGTYRIPCIIIKTGIVIHPSHDNHIAIYIYIYKEFCVGG